VSPSDASAPVGRLAPSPTGLLHLGHARSFLLAWWHTRARGGRVVLRVEDLDTDRVRPGMVDQTLADIEWLGLDWDGSYELQSAGIERIDATARDLAQRGLAYACACTRADLRAAASAPHQDEREARYPGTCRGRFASLAEARRATGRDAGLRFAVPAGTIALTDEFVGPFESDVAAEVGDFLITRRDGAPAYQLAVVVDDARQGVTEVVRGDDLLPSTARQWHLQRTLGLAHPRWTHVPLVLDASGRRLAKRADDLSLLTFRERGVDPRALVAWAARSAGMPAPERVTARDALDLFALERVPHAPVRVTPETIAALEAAAG
jgi:glutamyl-tRNA synthetase